MELAPTSVSPPQLIIFDCDGVLVDSETLGCRAVSEMASELGLTLSVEECEHSFRGVRMREVLTALENRLGRPLPESFESELRLRMAAAFRNHLRPIAGVRETLGELSIPFCVASNGPMEKMHLTLEIAGLLPRFAGRIFSAYEVGVWKPNPGLYLHAAKSMGAEPSSCIVVEDSIIGVDAAVAAGMNVFGFAPSGDGSELAAHGAVVFTSMKQLPALILVQAGVKCS